MKTKEYLGQWVKLKKYADKCFEELDEVLMIGPKSPQMDGLPRGSGGADISETVAKIEAIRKKAEEARIKALNALEEIQDVIEAVPDYEEKTILRLRYINGMKWEEVACAMSMGVRNTFCLHGKALQSAEIERRKPPPHL